MSHALVLDHSVPVELEPEGLGGYDHYHQFDSPSASAPAASQISDTLDASASGPPSWSPEVTQQQSPQPQAFSSHLPPDQEPQTQPYRPESVSAHALPSRSPVYSPRSTRSHSLAASLASGSQSPIRRKPLSPTASPLAVRFSARGVHMSPSHDIPLPESGFFSLDSPDLYEPNPGQAHAPIAIASLPTPLESQPEEETLDTWSPPAPEGSVRVAGPDTRNNIPNANPATAQTNDWKPTELLTSSDVIQSPTQASSDQINVDPPEPLASSHHQASSDMPMFGRKSIPHQLVIDHTNSDIQLASSAFERPPDSATSVSSLNKPLPKSPPRSPVKSPVKSPVSSSKLSSFFGWGAPSPAITEPSNKDYSPIPSPTSPKRHSFSDESPAATQEPIPVQTHAHQGNALGYIESYFPTPPNSYSHPSPIVEIEEMEDELKAISAELASSIRREMDLEDLVDRLQTEINNPQGPGKRSSDYFSDSGYSTAKFSEFDQSKEEISHIQRKAEQEKAQLRLELTNKLQEERGRRNALDQQIKELAEKASQADAAQMTSKDADARVKELERACEDLRRRLSEERELKDNFEDLLSALKGELQTAALERDNLRDEIVPQLKARVEGLEAQQADNEKLAYETTKLQQELQSLRDSKVKHDSLSRLRSSSITGQNFKLGRPPSGIHTAGLSRSNTVKGGHVESREALAERLKDVEAQRDALHSALKNLLDRQDLQNRENDKKVRLLETERDRLLSASPRKVGFEKEVTTLREEVHVLRRRAEEAIEQKWQVEKGLIGLKSDLDRAEEEIASLRALLNEKDILIPDSFIRHSGSSATGMQRTATTSSSLEKAYRDLQQSYRDALERIKDMEIGGTSASQDERTRLAMDRLEQSLSAALHDRDDARLEAGALQDQLAGLQESEKAHMSSERDLADQLRDSANRVTELTQQVRAQLAVNSDLRSRLTSTLARGEAGQQANKERLANMQNRMRILEEQVIAAQTAAEERVNRHEEELGSLRDANNTNLLRLRESNGGLRSPLRSPRLFPPKSPVTPLLSPNSARFPRMLSSQSRRGSRTRPGTPVKDEEDTKHVDVLKERVAELEKSLVTADFEMQEVVSRMNMAQIEVMTLQEEREAAVRDTRKLQKLLEAEKVKNFQDRFNTMTA